MQKAETEYSVEHYYLQDDGVFPNSVLPVLFYKGVLDLPKLFAGTQLRRFFRRNHWRNAWVYGIYEYDHYHSTAHEVLGVVKGETRVRLGGNKGIELEIREGDVLIIPAGVAHKNLGKEDAVRCVGAYPDGMEYDMNYGKAGERPQTEENIRKVPFPSFDPVFGKKGGLLKYWDEK